MRSHGTLTKWNDERGFGFITTSRADEEIFVHVSAFPRDGVRPSVGELISFDVEIGKDGRKRAIRVQRPCSRTAPHRRESTRGRPALRTAALVLLAAGAAGTWSIQTLWPARPSAPAADPAANESTASPLAAVERFSCDGRTRCTQMSSCDEATYFLRHCPGVQMDGDGDGVPCEDQWCR